MSEFSAKTLRKASRAKAARMASSDPKEKVDSSDWSPAEPLNADVKTGARPVSRRAFKSGGKVCGEKAKANMGRKPRKAGGAAPKDYANAKVNRNVKDANEEREGVKHVGGFKKGGRTKREEGGKIPMPPRRSDYFPNEGKKPEAKDLYSKEQLKRLEAGRKSGGRTKKQMGGPMMMPPGMMPDPRLGMVDPERFKFAGANNNPYKKGGKVKAKAKSFDEIRKEYGTQVMARGGKAHGDEAMDKALIKKMVKKEARTGRATGGGVFGEDRDEKAKGGSKKGKTNINIFINAGKDQPQDQMMAGPPPSPATPPGMMPADAAGGMPMGAMPPGAMGGAPAPSGMPPMGGMPPMPRNTGGRVGYAIGGKPVAKAPVSGKRVQMPVTGTRGSSTLPPGYGKPATGAPTVGQPRPGLMPPVQRDPGFGAPPNMGPRQLMGGMTPPTTVPIGNPPGFYGGPVRDPGFGAPPNMGPRQPIGGMMPPTAVPIGNPPGFYGGPVRDPGFGTPPNMGPRQPIAGAMPPTVQPITGMPTYGIPGGGRSQEILRQIGAVPRKSGGRVSKVAKSYQDMEAGAASGEGRLQKTDIAKRIPKPREDGDNVYDGKGYPNKVPGATGGRTAKKAGGATKK